MFKKLDQSTLRNDKRQYKTNNHKNTLPLLKKAKNVWQTFLKSKQTIAKFLSWQELNNSRLSMIIKIEAKHEVSEKWNAANFGNFRHRAWGEVKNKTNICFHLFLIKKQKHTYVQTINR